MTKNALLFICFFLMFTSLFSQEKVKVFVNAKIISATGEVFENGVLVIQNGKISVVGNEDKVSIPNGAEVVNLEGKTIIPGIVDTHSHIGIDWGFDKDSPTQPSLRILDAINPLHDTFNRARAGGITSVNIMPGSGHLMSGQTVYLKTKKTNNVKDMLFCDDVLNGICGGMKMANGTNSMREKPFPGTRGKSAAVVRELYYKAIDYKNKINAEGEDKSKSPPKDIGMDALVQILNGQRTVHHHTHRADDILTVLRLQEEFGFKLVLQHVSEGWAVAEEIAKAKVPCSVIIIDSPGGKLEAVNMKFENAKILVDAGVDVAIHTDDWITDSRFLMRCAALAVRAGLSEDEAIKTLTINGAKMLDIDDRTGSLEVGKDADFVVLSGSPLSVYTNIEQTWIDGEIVFNNANEVDHKYAVGGYNIYPSAGHVHSLCGEME